MARRRSRSATSAPSRRKARYSPAELFVALLGLGFLAVVIGIVITELLG